MRLRHRVFRAAAPSLLAVAGLTRRRGAGRRAVGVAGAADPRGGGADQERRAGQATWATRPTTSSSRRS